MHAGFSHWIGRNPLAVLALVAIAAIIAVDAIDLRASDSLLAATAALLVLTWWHPRVWLLLPAVAMLFAARHALRLEETRIHPLRQQLLAMGDQPVSVILRGHLFPYENGATLDARRALCEVKSVEWPGGEEQPLRAAVRLGLPNGFMLTKPGLYEIHADLTLPKPPMNPAQFNAVEYSLRMGWVAEGHANAVQLLDAEPWSPRFHLMQAAESCRQWICRQLSRDLEDDPDTAAVIMAMALGASEAAADEVEDAFRDSGTLHVFAVSGLHVALVATVGWLVLRLFSVRRALAVLVMIGIVFGYAFVTGWRPSAARAAWMIGVFMGASLIQRQSSLQNSLGAAALILLTADSHQLFQPGFQLSFGVLWAIAIGVAPLMTIASPWCQVDPFIPQPLIHWRCRAWSSVRLWCASLVSVSLAAWVGGFPLMLGHFQTVTPIALIANCFVVPLSFFCIGATCLSLGFASLGLVGAQVLMNNTNWLLAKTMVATATLFADAPMATFHLDPKPHGNAPPAELRVLYLPGGGAASHLRVGESQWLVDTGNAKGWRSTVRPYLRHAGVNRLDGNHSHPQ